MPDEKANNVPAETEGAPAAKSSGVLRPLLWAGIGMACGVGGLLLPRFTPQLFGAEPAVAKQVEAPPEVNENVEWAYVDFGEVVVNLNSDRLNRYLRVSISLLVVKKDETKITELVENQKAILKNWLLSYLSEVSMNDIRGAAGQNRLRREIQDNFNTVLFSDGYDRIRDVLFQEFNVQ